jgi:hypothetical protein
MAKMDDYLRSYGYSADAPTKRVAVSPRAPKATRRPWWVATMLRRLRRFA